jgi:NAD(P)-dependent dehydrogenase (short-subunit alcohol dehydrogenase family)
VAEAAGPDQRGPAGADMFSRRSILISGGTSGIGYAVAERLSATHDVWIMGSSQPTVDDVRGRLVVAGSSACDVADEDAVRNAVADAGAGLGGLDAVFVNAGIDGQNVPAVRMDIAQLRRVLEVNLVGAFLVAQAALGVLRRPATILFNASVNALRPEANFLDYNVSKAGVVSMAKTLALEVSSDGVSVMAVCFGQLPTRMTAPYFEDVAVREEILSRIPAGRYGTISEAAAVVEFLLQPEAAYLTGSVITMDGGLSI